MTIDYDRDTSVYDTSATARISVGKHLSRIADGTGDRHRGTAEAILDFRIDEDRLWRAHVGR